MKGELQRLCFRLNCVPRPHLVEILTPSPWTLWRQGLCRGDSNEVTRVGPSQCDRRPYKEGVWTPPIRRQRNCGKGHGGSGCVGNPSRGRGAWPPGSPRDPHPFSLIGCTWASVALTTGSFSLEEPGSATPVLLSSHSPHSAAHSKGPASTPQL